MGSWILFIKTFKPFLRGEGGDNIFSEGGGGYGYIIVSREGERELKNEDLLGGNRVIGLLDGERDEAVVVLDVSLEDIGAGSKDSLKPGPV